MKFTPTGGSGEQKSNDQCLFWVRKWQQLKISITVRTELYHCSLVKAPDPSGTAIPAWEYKVTEWGRQMTLNLVTLIVSFYPTNTVISFANVLFDMWKTELHSINKINYQADFWTKEISGYESRDLLNTGNSTALKSESLQEECHRKRSWNTKYSPIFTRPGHYSKISSHWDFSSGFAIQTDQFKWNEKDRSFLKF